MLITQQIIAVTGIVGQGECSRYGWRGSVARLCGVVVAIIVFTWGSSSALAQSDSRALTTQSPELQISTLEQRYDTQVINILSNYINRHKFFVDVNIHAEMVEETITTQSQASQSPSPDVTMPGLPFLPEENMRRGAVSESAGTVIDEHTFRTLRLRNITVNIYADLSFTGDDLQFMRLIAGIAAKIDETRGDQITITQTSIPNLGMEPPAVPTDTTQVSSQAAGTDWFASLPQYLLWLLLLVIAGLLMLAVRLYGKAQQASDSIMRRGQFKPHNAGQNSSRAPKAGQSTSKQVPENTEDSVFDTMTEKFFTSPREVTLLFESWIEEDQQEGVTKAAKVINAVDKQLIKAIKNELSEAHYSAIKYAADALPTLTNEQKQDIARDFNSTIEANSSRSNAGTKRRQLPLLKFSEHISDDRVLRMLDDSDPLPAALMLDYLSEAKAASIERE